MSKASAIQMATGNPDAQVNHSIITGAIPEAGWDPNEVKLPPVVPMELDSDRFAKLAAREAQLQKLREAHKADQAAVAAEKAKIEEVKKQLETFEQLKKTDPVKAFESLGFTQTDFVNWLGDKNTEPTTEQKAAAAAQAEIKKFHEEQAKKESEASEARDKRALDEYKSQIGKLITKEAEKYEFCAYNGELANELVFETVLEFIKDDPQMSPHQAMLEAISAVEELYENEAKEMTTKIKKLSKKDELLAAITPPSDAPLKAEVSPRTSPSQRNRTMAGQQVLQKKPLPTLSNNATATAASVSTKKESPGEKRARLEAILRNGGRL